jgi:hypothetical protein
MRQPGELADETTGKSESEPATWPPGIPAHISSTLDVRKNSLNKGGIVAVAAESCLHPYADPTRIMPASLRKNVITQTNQHVMELSGG